MEACARIHHDGIHQDILGSLGAHRITAESITTSLVTASLPNGANGSMRSTSTLEIKPATLSAS